MSSPLTTTAASSLITTTGVTSVATATTVSVTTSTITTSSTTSSSTTSSSTTSSSTTSSSTTSSSTTSSSTTSSSTTSSSTTTSTSISGTSNNQLDTPYGITHDWSANIFYITDQNNHRVMKYLSNSTSGTVVAGNNGQGMGTTQLNYPLGVYFDSSSNSLLIVNYGAHNVVRWVLGASSWTLVVGNTGVSGSTSTLLFTPFDVTCDSMNNVYVADSGNHRLQFFFAGQSNGTTVAGITGTMGSTSTLLNQPTSIVVDAQFNIYVVDYANSRIQEFLHY
ncbi:unnamed protein product [Rotaria sordida]|uniref:NHL repeat containing protein n=2 Tax=Rotaria sordida TaxID=392033 RepID=A0A819MYL3_9BILA|nr:unnamed protein product [Rotaria sordida]CAF3988276.1 unnamed protein product [Rotaria sordida]